MGVFGSEEIPEEHSGEFVFIGNELTLSKGEHTLFLTRNLEFPLVTIKADFVSFGSQTAFHINKYERVNKTNELRDNDAKGLFFSPDGSRYFTVGVDSNRINQFNLNNNGTTYEINNYGFSSKFIPTLDLSPNGIFFSTSGDRMFILDNLGNKVVQFNLKDEDFTPYELNNYERVDKILNLPNVNFTSMFFSPSGDKLFIMDSTFDRITQYNLIEDGTIFEIDSYEASETTLSVGDINPLGFFISPNGDKLFIVENNSNIISQYNLKNDGTPFELSDYELFNKHLELEVIDPQGLFITPTGSRMFVISKKFNRIEQLNFKGNSEPISFEDRLVPVLSKSSGEIDSFSISAKILPPDRVLIDVPRSGTYTITVSE